MSDLEEGELAGQQNDDWAASCDHAQSEHPARLSNPGQQHQHTAPLPGFLDEQQAKQTQQPTPGRKKLKAKVKGKGKGQQGAAQNGQGAAPSGAALGYYDVYGGAAARASIQIKATAPVQVRDVQGLVLWVLGESTCPRWVFVKNKVLIDRVVLVMAHGLTEHMFNEHKEAFTHLAALDKPVVTLALNSTVRPSQTVNMLLNVPMSKKRKRETEEEVRAAKRANNGRPPFPPTHYVMSLRDMEAANFPVPELGADGQLQVPEGHVATQPPPARSPEAPSLDPYDVRMVALDCEMCITGQGFELTRATLVSATGDVLLDELVVPYNPITDYNTRYSGITAAMLEGVTTRLEHVQKRILELIDADTLLCGHALDNDLRSLKIVHANVVDSSNLFPHPQGPPYRSGLKALASRYLQRNIQSGSHDSAEDARTAMDLILLKIKHGPAYGTPEAAYVDKLADVLADTPGRSVEVTLVDRQVMLARYATGKANAIPAFSDAQCAELAAKQVVRRVRMGNSGDGGGAGSAGGGNGSGVVGANAAPSNGSEGASVSNGAGLNAGSAGQAPEEKGQEGGSGSALSQSFVWAQLQELADFYHGRSQLQRKRQQCAADAMAAASTTTSDSAGTTAPISASHAAGQIGHAEPSTARSPTPVSGAGPSANGCQAVNGPSTSQQSAPKTFGTAKAPLRTDGLPALQPKPQRETPLQAQKRQLEALYKQEMEEQSGLRAGKGKAPRTDAGPQQTQRRPQHETPLQAQQRQLEALMQQERQQQQERQLQQLQRREERRQQEQQARPPEEQQEDLEALAQQYSQQQLLSTLQRLDRNVGSIYAALPPNSLLIVATGQGDTFECRRLQESKSRRQAGLEEPAWSVKDEEAYAACVDREMRALCFAVVKQ